MVNEDIVLSKTLPLTDMINGLLLENFVVGAVKKKNALVWR